MKKILSIALVVVLLAGIAVSGTMAYLTDTDSAVNVMTLGNVQIEQYEQDREGNEFQQGQTMYPIVKPASEKDNNGYPACENYLDKIVTVKNTGKSDAFVRTVIAIPNYTYDGLDEENASFNVIHWNGYSEGDAAPNYPAATRIPGTEKNVDNHWYWGKEDKGAWPGNGGDWNMVKAEINGQEYDVYVITHTTALKPNEITAPNMIGIYLDSKVDFDGTNYTYEGKVIEGLNGDVNVLVLSQAVQTAGFDDAFSALTAGFGEVTAATAAEWFGGMVILTVVSNADELTDAFAEGGSVMLKNDITGDSFEVAEDSKVDVDLNDKKLEGIINNNGDLNLSDGTVKADYVQNNGNATYTDVDMEAGTPSDYANISSAGSETVYNNVDITSGGGGIGAVGGAKVTFNSGSVAVNSTSTSGRYLFYTEGAGSEITINGGEFSFSKEFNQKRAYIYAGAGATVYVNGGTFGKASTRSGYTAGILGEGTVIIRGGTFGFDPSKWVDDGYQAVKDGSVWVVSAK